MQTELSHREAKGLFGDLVDQELPPVQEVRLRSHLDQCGECRQGWDRYLRVVGQVRKVEREKAPASLASLIMRRVRRRRGPKRLELAHAHYRVPVEAVIPILLGVAVAALLVLAAP